MRNVAVVVPLLCVAPLLQSCATTPNNPLAWGVVPYAQVRHAISTPDAYYELARYYRGQNRLEQAIVALKKALALDDSHAEAHNALGAIFALQGRFELALPEFERAIAIAPSAPHFRNNLGYSLYLQERHTDAVIAFEHAIALDPGNRNALNNLGLALAKLDLPEKSRDAFERAAAVPTAAGAVESDSSSPRQENAAAPTMTAATPPIRARAPEPLALPKDRAIIALPTTRALTISAAAAAQTMPAQPAPDSPLELVEVHPKVYELRRKEVAPTVATAPVASTATLPTASLARDFNLEVANGNGVLGMAKRVSRLLAASGLPVARLTNQKPFQQLETQIHYKEGYEKEALRLSESLRTKPAVKWAKGYARTDVRVVLGKDVATRFAVDDDGADSVHLAGYAGADD